MRRLTLVVIGLIEAAGVGCASGSAHPPADTPTSSPVAATATDPVSSSSAPAPLPNGSSGTIASGQPDSNGCFDDTASVADIAEARRSDAVEQSV